MTIDKIKQYMSAITFDFWANCQDVEVITKAKKQLEFELCKGILPNEMKYHAEIELLKLKLS